jgi:hypothetical protein
MNARYSEVGDTAWLKSAHRWLVLAFVIASAGACLML